DDGYSGTVGGKQKGPTRQSGIARGRTQKSVEVEDAVSAGGIGPVEHVRGQAQADGRGAKRPASRQPIAKIIEFLGVETDLGGFELAHDVETLLRHLEEVGGPPRPRHQARPRADRGYLIGALLFVETGVIAQPVAFGSR